MNDSKLSDSFIFTTSAEVHHKRRQEMLAKYPQIKELFGFESKTKYLAVILLLLQLGCAYYSQYLSWFWWFLLVYLIGATLAHSLYTVIHEITHQLAFPSRTANRLLALLINLPLGIPMAMGFSRYHFAHHRYMGNFQKDVDIPFYWEANFFKSKLGKFFWLMLQPFTYALRPFFKNPQPIKYWEIWNYGLQLSFDLLLIYLAGWGMLGFLILSSLLAMSLHPTAAHAIAEHYVVHENQETYSYYGPLNWILFNVGHHVEHHDFPGIPWSRVHKLRTIAPEYYENLYAHPSWIKLLVSFIASKKMTLFSRVIRN